MLSENLKEWIEILSMLWEDVSDIMEPLLKADKFECEVQKQKAIWQFFTNEEKQLYYDNFTKIWK